MKKRRNLYVFAFLFIFITNVQGQVRSVKNIDSDWSFILKDMANSQNLNFDDTNWEKVSLPHNWGYVEAQKGNKKYERKPGWYRRKIEVIPKKGRRFFIRFEAAASVSKTYLNGEFLGEHRGAFGSFCYEITDKLKSGNNILAVRVSNKAEADVAPSAGDFNMYGGLYRSVELIETSDVCFSLTENGSKGITWLQSDIHKNKAVLDLTAWISNGTKRGLKFDHFPPELNEVLSEGLYTLVAKIFDVKGDLVTVKKRLVNLSPNLEVPFHLKIEVQKPHLWNGVEDPYQYKAVVELQSQDEVVVDHNEVLLGLRSYYIDPDKGFFLNGKPYRLRGVSKHQDRKDKGWAITKSDIEEDIALINEIGANAIRCAHYQHSDYLMELCDRYGIFVWAEIPQVGGIKESFEFENTSRNQLLDMIRQNINHCSIFTWGLFNEIHTSKQDPHRSFVYLNNLAKSEDPTRPTVAATSHAAAPEMNKITDLLGWNRYPGWYDPIEDLFVVNQWDKYEPTSKNGGFCFSEYGAGANIEHHEQNSKQPVPKSFWHPEEWQARVHEAAWKRYSSTPYIWGSFVWNMFDFCAVRRREGGQIAINDKGLVTFDRKVKKDAFFFYKANWNDAPMLYLTSKRHLIRSESNIPIKVYCNIDAEVLLKVNGKKISKQKPSKYKIVLWENVKLKKGRNRIEVSVKNGDDFIKEKVIWKFDSKARSLKPVVKEKVRIGGDGGFGH